MMTSAFAESTNVTTRSLSCEVHLKDSLTFGLQSKSLGASPAKGCVFVRVRSVCLSTIDWQVSRREFERYLDPKRTGGIGYDFSGVVEAVNFESVGSSFLVGDEVFGSLPFCTPGSASELIEVKTGHCSIKPSSLSFTTAAALPSVTLIAYRALEACDVKVDDRVLFVNGHTPTGHIAIQLAKSVFGVEYTAVSCPESKRTFCDLTGAYEIFNSGCNKGDWSALFNKGTSRHEYDVIIFCGSETEEEETRLRKGIKDKRMASVLSLLRQDGLGRVAVCATSKSSFKLANASELLEQVSKGVFMPRRKTGLIFRDVLLKRKRNLVGKFFVIFPSPNSEVLERVSILFEIEDEEKRIFFREEELCDFLGYGESSSSIVPPFEILLSGRAKEFNFLPSAEQPVESNDPLSSIQILEIKDHDTNGV